MASASANRLYKEGRLLGGRRSGVEPNALRRRHRHPAFHRIQSFAHLSVILRPTPLTAAIAGAVAAALWPFIWSRFGGGASGGTVEFIGAILLTIALPAHALVLGLGGSPTAAPGTLDTGLFKRIGAWLGAAAVVMLLRPLVGL